MLQRIKLNLEAVEAMLYYWQAASEKENISENFFYDVSDMPALSAAYDDEFNGESVRRALSAIKNREPFDGNKKEKKFWIISANTCRNSKRLFRMTIIT